MIALLRTLWSTFVVRFTRLSGRALKPTRSGFAMLFLAFTVGFAAMNTGNNLLFFGWGLVLSGIVISGILSESTLQAATVTPTAPDELRAGTKSVVACAVRNERRLPGFGVELSLVFHRARTGDASEVRTGQAFELRLSPGEHKAVLVPFLPRARGALRLASLRVATAAPFGFFTKERIVVGDSFGAALVVFPERVDTRALAQALWARIGEQPAGMAGSGDELFSLRPFRTGDDPRRIAWRVTAKTGRMVLREHEATRSREIVVDVVVAGAVDADAVEDAIATAGSLVEDLLHDGHSVGVRAPGLRVRPSRSPRQRLACLQGLALVDVDAGDAAVDADGAAVVAVVAAGASAADADVVVDALPRASRGSQR
jgi:uncharacterized protein (DUF58 family)